MDFAGAGNRRGYRFGKSLGLLLQRIELRVHGNPRAMNAGGPMIESEAPSGGANRIRF
jgi:hypothetical protein